MTKKIDVPKGCEWRFEVEEPGIQIRLATGNAEYFGTELALGPPYNFEQVKGAIFTWQGCTLEVEGEPSVEYVAEETPMCTYLNLHFALENLRKKAEENASMDPSISGPRVCLIGPKSSGKTSVLKILESYALKQSRHPICVDLDPSQPMVALPGSISAFHNATILDIQEATGFGTSMSTGPTHILAKSPLVYNYGLDSPLDNPKLYKSCCSRLALAVNSRMTQSVDASVSGCLVDTCSLQENNERYQDTLHSIITDFRINIVLVLGSERLYSTMKRNYNNASWLSVVKLPSSGGCIEREPEWITRWQSRCLKQYFYGDERMPLSPLSIIVDSTQLVVYRVLEASESGPKSSVLPIGFEEESGQSDDKGNYMSLALSGKGQYLERITTEAMTILQNSILAISSVSEDENETAIIDSCILGYVFVTDVDDVKNRMTLLSPVPDRLPSNALIMGTCKWQE
ncbi:mRNA cleavage and polyadenylation specificity factor complex subunit [Schizosaccharomyces octosporus yFS286]|uniref:Polynucleotide 5'-hydroxyl-kinase GRC3 n=1 Tax=Schizosaccharomyces octosporus (strain yFS286) TaxID=483514 RepID=S9QWL6_SCHOY|nr:mRNA cleavage and polyadenylation specificity factor complex subunit [Schizosaccharomyces octosporus yFS286]EPX70695.1 mRNA cleavage and polyadenylation specificity factor complex subunit [Schizosaccharomyces octosporus yFS286]